MLKEARESRPGRAWLFSDRVRESLRVREFAERPEPGALSFFAPDFALNSSTPWLIGEEDAWSYARERLPKLISRADPSSAEFERKHEEILGRIARGEFEKVVPVVCEELEFESGLHAEMFLPEPRENQFTYGFEYEDEGMSGQTPELLFSVEDGRLKTMALAGTGRAGGDSLLNDPKERLEHQLVIDHILSIVRAWGEPEVGETVETPYGKLKHLRTPIEVKLSEPPDFMALVVKLHPTAALGGWPRQPAIEWLERQEFHTTRSRFGAPFGFLKGERMMCVVAIRSVQWKGVCAQIASGCGVVRGSQPLKEWAELQLKRDAVYAMMGVER